MAHKLLLVVCLFASVGDAAARKPFPTRDEVARVLAAARQAGPPASVRLLAPLLERLKRPRTAADERTLSYAAWQLARLYRQQDDDAVLEAVLAAGFDTDAAETMMDGIWGFLAADPDFLRRNPRAAAFYRSARGAPASLVQQEADCLHAHSFFEPDGRRAAGAGLLHAGTDPPARVFVDGKDTGLETPLGSPDEVRMTEGRHQVTFVRDGQSASFDVGVPPGGAGCVYQVLWRR